MRERERERETKVKTVNNKCLTIKKGKTQKKNHNVEKQKKINIMEDRLGKKVQGPQKR